VHNFNYDKDDRVYFYPWQDGYLEMAIFTGRLLKLSKDFSTMQTLRPASEPIRFDPVLFERLAKRFRYRGMLEVISLDKNRVVFSFKKPDIQSREKYPDPLPRFLSLENDKIIESTTIILGEHLGKKLLYDRVDQEFILKK
jgi:hypothetical protein